MKFTKTFESFTNELNEAKLKAGRDEPIAKAIIAYHYAVEGTPEGDAIRAMGQHPIRFVGSPKENQMMYFGGWSKDGIKALANVRRVPGEATLGTVVTLAADNGKSYYFDDVDFVENDKTIVTNTHKIDFREFIDTLVKKGVIEAPKY